MASTWRLVFTSLLFLCVSADVASSQGVDVSELTVVWANSFVQGDFDVRHYTGWLGSVGFRLTPVLSVVGEVSGEYNSDRFDDSFRYYSAVAGPKFSAAKGRARPYGQLAVGLIRSRTIFRIGEPLSYANNFFGFEPGGGVNVRLASRFDLRAGGNWLVTQPWHSSAWRSRHVRIVTGVTYRP